MTFSNLSNPREDPDKLLRNKLAHIGSIQEIRLWKQLVQNDQSLFNRVYRLIFCENHKISWHAAWVIDHATEESPELLKAYLPELIDQLSLQKSDALKRHFTRMLLSQSIPEEKMGLLIDVLYRLLLPQEAVAVRANALQLLLNLALMEPELQQELKAVAESLLDEELTPGMKCKTRKILQILSRQ